MSDLVFGMLKNIEWLETVLWPFVSQLSSFRMHSIRWFTFLYLPIEALFLLALETLMVG